ncbi:CNT_HP2_G0048790.mRNA.1.CDS.1 [Saccharomyces cerevisiae]|nr:CNT_HP2_G0048790.mRNA.1.CDS.1 [Saccharomyces cerevisiae]CAI6782835.1 CNT_HP2_G0048790.mRNA.1.CDS.1 [Saccharomyces cerevisiae]
MLEKKNISEQQCIFRTNCLDFQNSFIDDDDFVSKHNTRGLITVIKYPKYTGTNAVEVLVFTKR